MAWAIVRAHVQAITIDEAVTFTNFVRPASPAFWTAHANNHLLNSILTWGFARVFRASNLVARSGALIGAAIYILAAYFLSALIAARFVLRVFLFICLVFNPFIFDFLVAARGYGLASGFLLSAICLVAYALAPDAKSAAESQEPAYWRILMHRSFVRKQFLFCLRGCRDHRDAVSLGLQKSVDQNTSNPSSRLLPARACWLQLLFPFRYFCSGIEPS